MQISRNSEYYATSEQQRYSYHGYSNRLVFNIVNGAECLSGLGDNTRARSVRNLSTSFILIIIFEKGKYFDQTFYFFKGMDSL